MKLRNKNNGKMNKYTARFVRYTKIFDDVDSLEGCPEEEAEMIGIYEAQLQKEDDILLDVCIADFYYNSKMSTSERSNIRKIVLKLLETLNKNKLNKIEEISYDY